MQESSLSSLEGLESELLIDTGSHEATLLKEDGVWHLLGSSCRRSVLFNKDGTIYTQSGTSWYRKGEALEMAGPNGQRSKFQLANIENLEKEIYH